MEKLEKWWNTIPDIVAVFLMFLALILGFVFMGPPLIALWEWWFSVWL